MFKVDEIFEEEIYKKEFVHSVNKCIRLNSDYGTTRNYNDLVSCSFVNATKLGPIKTQLAATPAVARDNGSLVAEEQLRDRRAEYIVRVQS